MVGSSKEELGIFPTGEELIAFPTGEINENMEVYVAQALMVRTALLSAYLKFSRSLGGNVPYAYVVFLQARMPQHNLLSGPV